jgi:hypothetical protein
MTTTLKSWTHPTTGQIRIYVNDSRLWRGVKLFFSLQETGKIRFADFAIQGAHGQARFEAEQVAEEIGARCAGDWDQLVSMAQ